MNQSGTIFGGVDLLRFLAAVLVMLFHYGYWAWAYPKGLTSRAAGTLDAQEAIGALTSFGWVGVQIFFVISGFIIVFSAEKSTPSLFAAARVKRLVPAVWICAPISAAVLMLLDLSSGWKTAIRLANSMAFYPARPWVDIVYWTLGIEIVFYAIVWLLLATRRFHWLEAVAVGLGGISTLFWVAYHGLGWQDFAYPRAIDLLLLQHGCFFALGALIWLIRFKAASARRTGFAVVLLGGCVLQILATVQLHDVKVGHPTDWITPILVFLAAMAFLFLSLRLHLTSPLWRRIGMMTYPLYLLHNVVGAALLGALFRAGLPYLAAMAIASAAMIAAAWIIAERAEPPIRALISGLYARRPLKPARRRSNRGRPGAATGRA